MTEKEINFVVEHVHLELDPYWVQLGCDSFILGNVHLNTKNVKKLFTGDVKKVIYPLTFHIPQNAVQSLKWEIEDRLNDLKFKHKIEVDELIWKNAYLKFIALLSFGFGFGLGLFIVGLLI